MVAGGAREARAQAQRRLLRSIGVALSVLMVLLVLSVFVLIVRTESAHDEQACAFASLGQQVLGNVRVVEQVRNCLPELEERRYLVEREGRGSFELARKRLPRERFDAGRYVWSVREDDDHLLVLSMKVDGQPLSEFHEVDAPDRK